jgi:S-adenosylmethionine:tRNA ribosyltransferase-isomerase
VDISDFDYELPPERIAQRPLAERDASRLMLLPRREGTPSHRAFRELPELLSPGDLLVVNRSRVFPARLLGRRAGGGAAEALLLARRAADEWEALLRPGGRLKPGSRITVSEELVLNVSSGPLADDGRRLVRLEARGLEPEAAIARFGQTPLPPYIRRPADEADRERYQTVYAREPGSVAAPTAGLHFSDQLLERLSARGISRAELVLHVGPGTFRPVTASRVEEHRVEPEPFSIPAETAEAIRHTRAAGGRVVAVGTTTVRALETAADSAGGVAPGAGQSGLVILPGHRFRVVDALVTNFHLPRSSLLLLVAAFAGRERVLNAYAEAVRAGYRFYSYGDAMLLA